MKTSERHQLKSNEVAEQLARASAWASGQGKQLGWIALGVVALVVAAGGFWAWRQSVQERAGAALADAQSVAEAQIVAPDSGKFPDQGTFATEQARSEAAVTKFREVIQQYPSSDAATSARFEAASLLVTLGKTQEAEQYFREVMTSDGGIHGRTARLALAELQVRGGKYDEAITTFRDLASRKDDDLPVDGVLMQLGRVYEMAGKRAEALQTYQRVISEFPESIYMNEARRAADALKVGATS
jgi:TolA-binding protein